MPASGWPWMNGEAVAIVAQPIPPVHADDDRPALKDLFTEHRALIDQVATELATDPLFDANKHDDLWIVRFLLSHKKNVKAAVKAAKHTLLFRAEHKLDEKDMRYLPTSKAVPDESFQRYLKYCGEDTFQITVPDAKLGVVFVFCAGSVDHHGLVANVDEADWLPSFIYFTELTYQWLDYQSRTTGRLTQSMRIIDLTGVTVMGTNLECKKRDGNAMKATEDCYPQLLKCLYVVHSPTWVQAVWRILRPFFPKRVVEKADFISPDTNTKERDRMLKYIAMEHLPTRYGGKNDVWPLNFELPGKKGEEEECTA